MNTVRLSSLNVCLLIVPALLYGIAVPYLEINETHVFNPDWPPHARLHEVWQLLTHSGLAVLSMYCVLKGRVGMSFSLNGLLMGGFFLAYALQHYYGGSMMHSDGQERTLFGLNMGVAGFGIAFVLMAIGMARHYRAQRSVTYMGRNANGTRTNG